MEVSTGTRREDHDNSVPLVKTPLEPATIVCWKWSKPGYRVNFTAEHVNALMAPGGMVDRNYKSPHRRVCITDDPTGIKCETLPLWDDHNGMDNACGKHLPSCYRRLKIFDKNISRSLGARIISLDLDVVICGDMRPVWDRPATFCGWQVEGHTHSIVYNGSMFMFESGQHSDIWDTFDPNVSPMQSTRAGYFGSDQAWISFKIRGRLPGWTQNHGVYSYPRDVRKRQPFPHNARIVIFHGKRKPWDPIMETEAPWIAKHWRIV
jgi:hypothetical protein